MSFRLTAERQRACPQATSRVKIVLEVSLASLPFHGVYCRPHFRSAVLRGSCRVVERQLPILFCALAATEGGEASRLAAVYAFAQAAVRQVKGLAWSIVRFSAGLPIGVLRLFLLSPFAASGGKRN